MLAALLSAPLFDTGSWISPFILGILVGLDQGHDLSDRLQGHVQRFEWDRARVALRTLYFSLMIGLMVFLFRFDEALHGDQLSVGPLLALAAGGGFVCAFMATATESPRG